MPDDLGDYRKALPGLLDPIPPELLAEVGSALYGRDWVSALARDLGVTVRSVDRWKSGRARLSPRFAAELAKLLADRAAQAAKTRRKLRPYVKAAEDAPPVQTPPRD